MRFLPVVKGRLFFIAVTAVSLGAFLILVFLSFHMLNPRKVSADVVQGKKVWQKQACVECHTILGAGGYNGPELTHETTRRSRKWLIKYLTKPPVMYPNHKRRHPAVTLPEAKALINYMSYLERIKINGWPPKPLKSLSR